MRIPLNIRTCTVLQLCMKQTNLMLSAVIIEISHRVTIKPKHKEKAFINIVCPNEFPLDINAVSNTQLITKCYF